MHVDFGEVREEWRDGFSQSGRKDGCGSRALQVGLDKGEWRQGLELQSQLECGSWAVAGAVSQGVHEVSLLRMSEMNPQAPHPLESQNPGWFGSEGILNSFILP